MSYENIQRIPDGEFKKGICEMCGEEWVVEINGIKICRSCYLASMRETYIDQVQI